MNTSVVQGEQSQQTNEFRIKVIRMPNERIEARYKELPIKTPGDGNGGSDPGKSMYHRYIVYVDKDGNLVSGSRNKNAPASSDR